MINVRKRRIDPVNFRLCEIEKTIDELEDLKGKPLRYYPESIDLITRRLNNLKQAFKKN
jgi:hypothetical protein